MASRKTPGKGQLKRKLPSKPVATSKSLNGSLNGANGANGANGHDRDPHPRTLGNRRQLMLLDTYQPEYAKEAAEMVANGALELDLITAFQITRTVFSLWKARYPDFRAACEVGLTTSAANAAVVRSVYEMANGYTQRALKIHVTKEGDVVKVPYIERIKKDISAAKFWLANRDPVNWGRTPDDDKSRDGLPSVLNSAVLKGMDSDTLKATIAALQALLTPGGSASQNQGLKRLDFVDAEVIPVDPSFKPKRRRTKKTEPTDGT